MMDIKDLKVLVKMITETDITEFEIENGEERIFLKRGSEPQIVQYQAAPAQMYAPHAVAAVPAAATAAAPLAVAEEKGDRVPSPIVGTPRRFHNTIRNGPETVSGPIRSGLGWCRGEVAPVREGAGAR